MRSADRISLYLDGKVVGAASGAEDYDLSNNQPLRIGFGPNDYFKGSLSDVKIFSRALTEAEIQSLTDGRRSR